MDIFRRNKERGFTGIEIMLVVAIIGILMTIGGTQFQRRVAQGELDRATQRLASDIRLMQQLSASNVGFPVATGPIPAASYRYRLRLWDSTVSSSPGITPNGYQVLDNVIPLQTRSFDDDNVRATIVTPTPVGGSTDITYWASELDRTTDGTSTGILVNRQYQIRLTHNVTNAVRVVTVDPRVGRVVY